MNKTVVVLLLIILIAMGVIWWALGDREVDMLEEEVFQEQEIEIDEDGVGRQEFIIHTTPRDEEAEDDEEDDVVDLFEDEEEDEEESDLEE